jgi:RNA-directed DNA polymerase
VQPLGAHFVPERGLELAHEKTSIPHVEDGLDFLGPNVRRYGTKLLWKPSRKNVRSFLAPIDDGIQPDGGYLPAGELIRRRNPKRRGGALDHRHASSQRTLARLDDVILKKRWRWARRRHRGQSAAWVRATSGTRPGEDRWTFRGRGTDPDGGHHTVGLLAARSVRIRRPVQVRGDANPYDPSWELYCAARWAAPLSSTLTGRGTSRYLGLEPDGNCRVCGQPLDLEAGWHLHHRLGRWHGGDDTVANLVLLHPNGHRQVHGAGLVVNQVASRAGRS